MATHAHPERVGVRAITMQQPYAWAMAAGYGLYTRRGRATRFREGRECAGEWVAIHVGCNSAHLQNAKLMAAVRRRWPQCPSDGELRGMQRCIIGAARFVDGSVSATNDADAKNDWFLSHYDCSKTVAWRADRALLTTTALQYPRGQVQVWHLKHAGFEGGKAEESALLRAINADEAKSGLAVKEEVVLSSVTKRGAKKRSRGGSGATRSARLAAIKVERPRGDGTPSKKRRRRTVARRTRSSTSRDVKSVGGATRKAKVD